MEGIKLIIGCNYHTTWQREKEMRFVLVEVRGDRARLMTRRTGRNFWTAVKDLIFIESKHNIRKGERLVNNLKNKES